MLRGPRWEADMTETRRTRASHRRAPSSDGREGLNVGLAAAVVIALVALAFLVLLWLLPPL